LVTTENGYGLAQNCELKKPQFFLTGSEKNSGDDPRASFASDYVCYKAKCSGALIPDAFRDSQFGLNLLTPKKTKIICLPTSELIDDVFASALCSNYQSLPACTTCCDADTTCEIACGDAVFYGCADDFENLSCASSAAAAKCGLACLP
jgi:hypothetical protein